MMDALLNDGWTDLVEMGGCHVPHSPALVTDTLLYLLQQLLCNLRR